MNDIPHPDPLLEIRVDRLDLAPPLSAACAGYELGDWRAEQLARHVMEWLPEFALRYSEWSSITHADAVAKAAKAAAAVYSSPAFERRGEFGEVLLHVILRQHFNSVPVVSKIYFKDSPNDTVKGFDAVHVVERDDLLELWLGEVKFYRDVNAAIRDVVAELEKHTGTDYLRTEFVAITNKIDDAWPQGRDVRDLLSRQTPLDEIFEALCIPVLLTYDSDAVASHEAATKEYLEAFEAEATAHWERFRDKLPALPIRVHLFLLPIKSKEDLVAHMDACLRHAQGMA